MKVPMRIVDRPKHAGRGRYGRYGEFALAVMATAESGKAVHLMHPKPSNLRAHVTWLAHRMGPHKRGCTQTQPDGSVKCWIEDRLEPKVAAL